MRDQRLGLVKVKEYGNSGALKPAKVAIGNKSMPTQ